MALESSLTTALAVSTPGWWANIVGLLVPITFLVVLYLQPAPRQGSGAARLAGPGPLAKAGLLRAGFRGRDACLDATSKKRLEVSERCASKLSSPTGAHPLALWLERARVSRAIYADSVPKDLQWRGLSKSTTCFRLLEIRMMGLWKPRLFSGGLPP